MESYNMIHIDSMPKLYDLYEYLIKTTDDLNEMEIFVRRYFRYYYKYIKTITIETLMKNYRNPIGDKPVKLYYILHINNLYMLYYRIPLRTNTLEGHCRYILYKKDVNVIYGDSFKDYEYCFDSFNEAVCYVDNILYNRHVRKHVMHPHFLIYYENVVINDTKYILMVKNHLNRGNILCFDMKIWDLKTLIDTF